MSLWSIIPNGFKKAVKNSGRRGESIVLTPAVTKKGIRVMQSEIQAAEREK